MKAERDCIYKGQVYLRGTEMPKEYKAKNKKPPTGTASVVIIHRPEGVPLNELDDNPLTRTYSVDDLRDMDTKSLKAVAEHRSIKIEPTPEDWSEAAERDQIIDKILAKQKAGNTTA